MEKDRLDKIFERWWPDLESDTTAALARVSSPKPERKMQDIMAEVVEDRRLDEDLVLAENGQPSSPAWRVASTAMLDAGSGPSSGSCAPG